jgi:hypothetical protein
MTLKDWATGCDSYGWSAIPEKCNVATCDNKADEVLSVVVGRISGISFLCKECADEFRNEYNKSHGNLNEWREEKLRLSRKEFIDIMAHKWLELNGSLEDLDAWPEIAKKVVDLVKNEITEFIDNIMKEDK